MNALSITVPLPPGFTPLLAQVQQQLGDSLVALLMFGSCLCEHTRQPSSVPDLLAFVDDMGKTLRRLGSGPVTRALAGWLPPLTLALREPTADGGTLAKLNLVELAVAQAALRKLPDLYLAGRLSKPMAWLWHRDAASGTAVEALLQQATTVVADLTLRGLDGQNGPIDLEQIVLLYIGQSYLAEVRPEGRNKWYSLRSSFPTFYDQRVRALLVTRAPLLGLCPVAIARPGALSPLPAHRAPPRPGDGTALLDKRTAAQRHADHHARTQLVRRSRWRTLLRWPKMALVYRGWLPYLLGKLQRVSGR